MLLDSDLNVTEISKINISFDHEAAIKVNNNLLYSMKGDGYERYLVLVDASLNRINQCVLSHRGLCLHKIDDNHVILGQAYGYLTIF